MSYLYEQVASELGEAIEKGVFPPGARLPSIRNTQKRFGVSVATAMEAFARLEVEGLIEVRPKSGHFVKPRSEQAARPRMSNPEQHPGSVSIVDMALEMVAASQAPGAIPFAAGFPGAEVLQLDSLARIQARAVRTSRKRLAGIEPPEGMPALRHGISRLIADAGAIVEPSGVVVTNGAQEALNLALRAVTSPGDVVAVESPTYFGVLQAIESLGLKALELPTHPEHGVSIEALEKAVSGGAISACVLSPSYQNPLGFCMNDDDKRRVVELLEGHDVPLIEDDVWGCLGLANPRPVTAKSFDRSGNVILLSSFSKTVSPGLRLGWMAPGKFLQEVVRQKFLVNLSTGVVQQQAIADFLDGSRFRRLTQSSSKIYARRRKFLRDAVIRHFPPGTLCSVPRGGFFIWVELPGNVDSYELFKLAVNEGISFSPGRLYSRTSTYSHCLRLSCSVDDDAVVENAIRELAWLVPR